MAFLPIEFPDDWPDFVVTSHKRPTGSHALGNAIDITPIWPADDMGPGSKFWYYYFHTFFVLWAAQSKGITRLAVPPTCPHYHIVLKPSVNVVGLEWMERITDKKTGEKHCHTYYHRDVSKYDAMKSIEFHNFIMNEVSTGNKKGKYYGNWRSVWADLGHKFDFSKKKVEVIPNQDSLSDEYLQQLLNVMYGESTITRVLDQLTHIVTGLTLEEAKAKAKSDALLWGSLAVLGLFLYKEISKEPPARSARSQI